MINFRQTDLPLHYEPVIVDHRTIDTGSGNTPIPALKVKTRFDEAMAHNDYLIYGVSHISPDHIQVVYLSRVNHDKAREDFLRSNRSSLGTINIDASRRD